MGKSTAIILILMALGPNKGAPDSKTIEQELPTPEKQVLSSSLSPAAESSSPGQALPVAAPASPLITQLEKQEPAGASSLTDQDEPPLVAKTIRKDHGR